jgi:hypothetical protein
MLLGGAFHLRQKTCPIRKRGRNASIQESSFLRPLRLLLAKVGDGHIAQRRRARHRHTQQILRLSPFAALRPRSGCQNQPFRIGKDAMASIGMLGMGMAYRVTWIGKGRSNPFATGTGGQTVRKSPVIPVSNCLPVPTSHKKPDTWGCGTIETLPAA